MKRSEIKTRTPLKRGKGLARATKPMARKARLKARTAPRAFRQRRDPQVMAGIHTQPCVVPDLHAFFKENRRISLNNSGRGTQGQSGLYQGREEL